MTLHKSIEAAREAFEKEWPNWDKYPSGNYMDEIVQTAWENFQAGYAATLPAEPMTEEEINQIIFKAAPNIEVFSVRKTIKALRDAGVLYVKGVG